MSTVISTPLELSFASECVFYEVPDKSGFYRFTLGFFFNPAELLNYSQQVQRRGGVCLAFTRYTRHKRSGKIS